MKSPGYDYYSDNQFALSTDGKFRLREVDESEWDAAQKPLHSYHFIASSGAADGVQYSRWRAI